MAKFTLPVNSIVKEGKELDEFIEKSNDQIMKDENNDRS